MSTTILETSNGESPNKKADEIIVVTPDSKKCNDSPITPITTKKKKSIKKQQSVTPSSSSSKLKAKQNVAIGGTSCTKNSSTAADDDKEKKNELASFKPLSLTDIRNSVMELCTKVPSIPTDGGLSPSEIETVKDWATQMSIIIEEINLLLACVAAATYQWGTDRTGADDQNLDIFTAEVDHAQSQINSLVSTRLTNVLEPFISLCNTKTVIVYKKKNKDDDTTTTNENEKEEIKTHEFQSIIQDPNSVKLYTNILCRNAPMLRQLVLTNFQKICKCIDDYLKATNNNSAVDKSPNPFYAMSF